ncbi:MAG: hypothetical protein ACKVIV_01620 [Flavobacteriales bacterium]|jgi:hypothetical protein|tara:strand:+ start:6822 stop:7883 length:1062 start_codon:yes stop_codon:yes gene_type:complete
MYEKLMSDKKPSFPISKNLDSYLSFYNRKLIIPIFYEDLKRFSGSVSVYNEKDIDTLWVRAFYSDFERKEIDESLKRVYNLLHSDGNEANMEFLNVDAIDYCTFGNSKPFRIKIRNILNDNFTYFYVKKADASRIYGLELEHILSPDNLNFLVYQNTLIEEHIAGIPGDEFLSDFLNKCNPSEKSQIAKEFVKFNERCMIRLLGDMRSYNYVIIPTHDFDQVIYKIRAIDFDQQSFEGKLKVYRPQFFKENKIIMELIKEKLNKHSVDQYKTEERSIIAKRILSSESRVKKIIKCMMHDNISTPKNIDLLSKQIYSLTRDESFKKTSNMGGILKATFDYVLKNYENHGMLNVD